MLLDGYKRKYDVKGGGGNWFQTSVHGWNREITNMAHSAQQGLRQSFVRAGDTAARNIFESFQSLLLRKSTRP